MQLVKSTDLDLTVSFLKENFSSPTHWPEWNLWVQAENDTDFFYIHALDKGKLVGICPVHVTKEGKGLQHLYSGQYKFIPYGGWIFSSEVSKADSLSFVESRQALTMHSLPILSEFNASFSEDTLKRKTLVIDLDQTEEELWSNCVHSKRRNMIRKAEKIGVESKIVSDEQGLKDFYRAYSEASIRNDLHVMPLDFFRKFEQAENLKLTFINAYQEDKLLSNVGILMDKNYAIYWLGNNPDNVRNEGQGEMLQWEGMKLAKANGCKYYDLCYIEPEKLPHIYKFKKGFSKQEVDIALVQHKHLSYKVVNKLLK